MIIICWPNTVTELIGPDSRYHRLVWLLRCSLGVRSHWRTIFVFMLEPMQVFGRPARRQICDIAYQRQLCGTWWQWSTSFGKEDFVNEIKCKQNSNSNDVCHNVVACLWALITVKRASVEIRRGRRSKARRNG